MELINELDLETGVSYMHTEFQRNRYIRAFFYASMKFLNGNPFLNKMTDEIKQRTGSSDW